MGAVNYGTSDYITLGLDLSRVEEQDDQEYFMEKVQEILDRYSFYTFHVVLKNGYYEGFYIDIETNFPIYFNDYVEKQEAQKDVTQLKLALLECLQFCVVECSPGWCTGYSTEAETISAIKKVVVDMRGEIRTTPTYRQFEKECS